MGTKSYHIKLGFFEKWTQAVAKERGSLLHPVRKWGGRAGLLGLGAYAMHKSNQPVQPAAPPNIQGGLS